MSLNSRFIHVHTVHREAAEAESRDSGVEDKEKLMCLIRISALLIMLLTLTFDLPAEGALS